MSKLAMVLFLFSIFSFSAIECSISVPKTVITTSTENSMTQDSFLLPLKVEKCLEENTIKGRVDVLTTQNPYFVRGDFDGDTQPDYAVAVRWKNTQRNSLLICTRKGKPVILGTDDTSAKQFSDKPDDNFMSSNWDVFTKEEAQTVRKYNSKGISVPVAHPKGESIAMIWEDGICLIYWDGSHYKWGCGQ